MKDYIAAKKTHIAEIPKKQLWLAGIFVAGSVAMWLFLLRSLTAGFIGSETLVYLLAAGLGWIVLFNLTLLFLSKTPALLSYAVLFLVLFFFFGLQGFTIVGILVFTLAMLWAYQKANNERKLLVEFKTFRILKRALPIFFTGLALFLAFAYNSLVLQDVFEDDLIIPPQLYDTLFGPTEVILSILFPDYEKGMSIGEFQEIIVESFLPPEILDQIGGDVRFAADFLDEEISAQSLRDFSYNWLNENTSSILEPFRGILPFLFIIGLFFVFKTFSLPLLWFSFGVSWLVVKVLLLYNVVAVRTISVDKKEMVLK